MIGATRAGFRIEKMPRPKRTFRQKRSRIEKLWLRDAAIATLIGEHGWTKQDIEDAFGLGQRWVNKITRNHREAKNMGDARV